MFAGCIRAHHDLRNEVVSSVHVQTEVRKRRLDLREQSDEFVGPLDRAEFGRQFGGGAFAAERVDQFRHGLVARILQDSEFGERKIEERVGGHGHGVGLAVGLDGNDVLGRAADIRGDLVKVDQREDLIQERGDAVVRRNGEREFRCGVVEEVDLPVGDLVLVEGEHTDQRAVKVDLELAGVFARGPIRNSVELVVVVVERERQIVILGLERPGFAVLLGRRALERAGKDDTALTDRFDPLHKRGQRDFAFLLVGHFAGLFGSARGHQESRRREQKAKQKCKKSGFHSHVSFTNVVFHGFLPIFRSARLL